MDTACSWERYESISGCLRQRHVVRVDSEVWVLLVQKRQQESVAVTSRGYKLRKVPRPAIRFDFE